MSRNHQLKIKYSFGGILVCWVCLAISAYPVWAVAEWLSILLGIPENAPVKDQEYGWFWFAAFIVEAIFIFLMCYALIALLIGKVKGWPKVKTFNIFFKSKYPDHWYKSNAT